MMQRSAEVSYLSSPFIRSSLIGRGAVVGYRYSFSFFVLMMYIFFNGYFPSAYLRAPDSKST